MKALRRQRISYMRITFVFKLVKVDIRNTWL